MVTLESTERSLHLTIPLQYSTIFIQGFQQIIERNQGMKATANTMTVAHASLQQSSFTAIVA